MKKSRVTLCALYETRVKSNKLKKIVGRCFEGWSYLNNYQEAYSGRIWLLWETTLFDMELITMNDQLIHVKVNHKLDNSSCFLSALYTNEGTKRAVLWDLMKQIAPDSDKEWLVMRDFKEVTKSEEKVAQGEYSINKSGLKECCIQLDLVDLKSVRVFYTWCNNQEGDNKIYCKLDRVMGNSAWFEKFSGTFVNFQNTIISDHAMTLVNFQEKEGTTRPPFK